MTTDIVFIQNNQAITTSTQVASDFEKEHKNILRDIENLKKDVLNFEQMFYEGETPDSYGRPRKTFFMNRDGFTLLAMGFTGKKAIGFKLKYIQKFNEMEEYIKNQNQPVLTMEDLIIRNAQILKETRLKQEAHERQLKELEMKAKEQEMKVDKMLDYTTVTPDFKGVEHAINKYCRINNKSQAEVRKELYKKLGDMYGINFAKRVENKHKEINNARELLGKKPYKKSTLDSKYNMMSVIKEEKLEKQMIELLMSMSV